MFYYWSKPWHCDEAELYVDEGRRFECLRTRPHGSIRFSAFLHGKLICFAPSIRALVSKVIEYHELTKPFLLSPRTSAITTGLDGRQQLLIYGKEGNVVRHRIIEDDNG